MIHPLSFHGQSGCCWLEPDWVIVCHRYGNLSSVTDANNHHTSYTHDDLGGLIGAVW